MSKQCKKVIYGRRKHKNRRNKLVVEQERKGKKNRKAKRRLDYAANLSDLYPSTCLAWEALPGV